MELTISDRINADRRGVLSSLWIFVLFNMLFRDIHEFARAGWIEELMSMEVADGLLLASGIVLSLIISMVVLNRVLSFKAARRSNVTVAIVTIASMVANPPGDLDDIWFFAVEILALLAIIRFAWTWRTDSAELSPDPLLADEI